MLKRMDAPARFWHFSDMEQAMIPAWQLYGENRAFPDVLHIERIVDRAAGLDWRIAPHRHTHLHQIFLLISGTADLTVDGAQVPVTTPVLLNLPRGVAHGFRFSAGTEGYVLTLPMQDLPDLFAVEAEAAQALSQHFSVQAEESMTLLFNQLAQEHAGRNAHRQTRLKALATLVVCDLLRLVAGGHGNPETQKTDPRVSRFKTLVEQQYRLGWGVDLYARTLGLSPRHLTRLCRTTLGLSAQEWIADVTFREACSLLVYTRMTVASVGYAVGFADPAYFTRAFQRHLGMTPTTYRARFDA